jgi:maltooligosyltrehalose trehalohydrolase
VWAPERTGVSVVVEEAERGRTRRVGTVPLRQEQDGYFAGAVQEAGVGTLYRFLLAGEHRPYPDPASRFQPRGPHGPSQVVDPTSFAWTDGGWRGAPESPVLYELHVGTFSAAGTWSDAAEKLEHLAALGVNVLEVMPVAEFPGAFGWGYDGVGMFAPYHHYGTPDDFRRFVDAAHRVGLAVILDVVYNHWGPDGNYTSAFSDHYASQRHTTDWGAALNFDGPGSEGVRAFCQANVRHWIEEYHLDGFRFDATQDLYDDGPEHILAVLAREAREAAGERRVLLVAENEPQNARIVRPVSEGGYGLDVIGNDDFHHTAFVALTGRRQGYYSPYLGSAQELVSGARFGFLYQGQWYPWQRQRRGTATRGLPASALLHYLENHDQVANSAHGRRLQALSAPGAWRALTALLLLGPQTPLLFQGQEFASSAPFHYFADHSGELARAVWRGRLQFLRQFEDYAATDLAAIVPDPSDASTFTSSKLDWSEAAQHAQVLALHVDLLRLRRDDGPLTPPRTVEGAALGPSALVLRGVGAQPDGSQDRLLLLNLGDELSLLPAPEPLLAPPSSEGWALVWSSEDPRYGGTGTPPVETEAWNLPGKAALVLAPKATGSGQAGRPANDEVR